MSIQSLVQQTTQWLCGAASDPATAATESPSRRVPREGPCDLHYCQQLDAADPGLHDESEVEAAWSVLEECMAFVPAGEVSLVANTLSSTDLEIGEFVVPTQRVRTTSVFMDRFAVTNQDFSQFIASGGYRRTDLWPAQILPQVLQYVDQTGSPGPRFWSQGRFPSDQRDHPVVGVCWYEANAYARWVGKRLPTPAEWQRAGSWSDGEGAERRYPWGNAFDPRRTNIWLAGRNRTVPVSDYYDGCTANGIYQLSGNVWEWVAALFECDCQHPGAEVVMDQTMGEIRGGAYDTYFETQATGQFRSGQPLLYRGANVGFRCCIGADELIDRPHSLA